MSQIPTAAEPDCGPHRAPNAPDGALTGLGATEVAVQVHEEAKRLGKAFDSDMGCWFDSRAAPIP